MMREKAKAARPTIECRLTYAGITVAAQRFGCSREHLSRVLHGKRKANARLARGLKRMGLDVEVARMNGEEVA